MPVDLRDLITASFDAAAAEARSKFTLDEADKLALREAAMKVLGLFPGRMAGQCTLTSPAYSIALEKLRTQPGYVVAGSLYIGDKRIFGDDKEFDGKVLFSKSNPGWNGHAWIVYGDYLADVSVFAPPTPEARAYCLNMSPWNTVEGAGSARGLWQEWTQPVCGMSPNMC
jgi:hypothetical protein